MTPFALLLLLAVIQGLTEYLPVSSSGHLVLGRLLIPGGESLPADASVEVMLHLGTLAAVILYYRREIKEILLGLVGHGSAPRKQRHLALGIFVASIPAGLVGVLLKDQIEQTFSGLLVASSCLIITGLILWSARKQARGQLDLLSIGVRVALLIGCAQAFAILPGISRSGATIICGLWLGLSIEAAAAFSFLISIPAIGGAALLKLPAFFATENAIPEGLALF